MRNRIRSSFRVRATAVVMVAAAVSAGLLLAVRPAARAADDTAPQQSAPRRVKVLFLGDNGHHRPLERCRQIFSELGRRGIDLTYTDRVSDLNPQTLNRYDCLLLYANIERIAPEQEKALLEYVASGRGFVPVHCASYCFLNSPKITALTGARFQRHGTGVFRETHAEAAASHPAIKGVKPIESWDETYVHNMHNEQDRTVLSYRVEGDRKEPYTWVRTHGQGRVFYTAWGHDERTWGHPDFEHLLERGVRWAAGDWALQPQPQLKGFEYAEANLPNYLPGKPWGTTGDPITIMQLPVSPQESMKHMVAPPGFEVKLFAAEPDIRKPICMAHDERGRLWVAETFDYPNELQPEGEGNDRITICEDTDADGKADKFTVFADKLSIPTSLCFANGGVIVTQAPHTLFFKDTDGDDKADERKVLFTGWGTGDTHAGPSNLRWGLDGWVYGTCGYSGFRGEVGGQQVRFGQGVFRMNPDGSKLEFLASTTNNTWGLGFSEEFHILGSTANRDPSFYLHIPNRHYETARGLVSGRLENIADTFHFYPITDKVRQVDQHGGYTAGAGHALYTARSFPAEYWNRIAFVTEPTGHIVGQFVIEPKGSAFTARNDFNLLASTDEWTSPIMAEVGPDGSVWVIDWYNYIIQHNPIPRGFEKGKGNAYVTPLRDKRHGRVYRVVYTGGKPSQTFDLSKADGEQLVAALKSDNMLWRTHAQRLIVEKGDKSLVPALAQLAQDPAVDAKGLNPAAIHALWALHLLGAADGPAAQALDHPSAGVRKAAVETLPRTGESADAVIKLKVLEDPDPQVRKSALLALSEMPASDAAGAAVFAILAKKENADDRWLTDAAAIAAVRHDAGFLKAAFAAHPAKDQPAGDSAPRPVAANLMPNPSFEEGEGERPRGWRPRHYSGVARQTWVDGGRTGAKALRIESDRGADSSWYADVRVEPQTEYRFSGWVKPLDVQKVGQGMGALFNVHGTDYRTPAVAGAGDWKKLEITFNSGTQTRVSINCLFGGWGRARGAALYDDVELVKAEAPALPGAEGRVVAVVVNQYASRAPADTVVATLSALKQTDPRLATVVIGALFNGWPEKSPPKLSDAEAAELAAVMKALAPEARDRLLQLVDRWGRRDLFAQEIAAATKELRQEVENAALDASRRSDAARRLLSLDDTPASIEAVLKQVTPLTAPEVQAGLLEALSASRSPAVGEAIVGRWGDLTPAGQKAALELLLRRVPWTTALLSGVRAGTINSADLARQHWQNLTTHPDRAIAREASELEKSTGRAVTAERKELVDKFMPLANKPGDISRGKLAYEKNCMVCHTLEGQGGKVGPDLTGVGARPRSDILIEILDPNRSVEGTYRQWTVKTKDDVISGRLLAESRTSIEIIDAAGMRHVINREDIDGNRGLRPSNLSVMPEGFELLPPEDLIGIIEYLSTSKVKH